MPSASLTDLFSTESLLVDPDQDQVVSSPTLTPLSGPPADTAAGGRPGGSDVCPAPVLRRASHNAAQLFGDVGSVSRVAVGLDWIRCSGPEVFRREVMDWLQERLESRPAKGLWLFKDGVEYGPGVRVVFNGDGSHTHFAVQVTGAFLGALSPASRMALLGQFRKFGLTVKRLDVAVDLVASSEGGVRLVDQVISACESGHLCGAKVFTRYSGASAKKVVNKGISIGRRGRYGSGRYIRCYDKGLESRLAPENTWHRWEVEFHKDCAHEVAEALLDVDQSNQEAIARRAMNLAFGAVEFRHDDGGDCGNLSRRTLCRWWSDLVRGLELVRVRLERTKTTLEGRVRWLRKAVIPGLKAMAQSVGHTFGDVVHALAAGVPASSTFNVAAFQASALAHDITFSVDPGSRPPSPPVVAPGGT